MDVTCGRHLRGRAGRRLLLGAALAVAALLVQAGCVAPASAQAGPKNVIVLISDGCGYVHIEAADLYEQGRTGAQPYEQFPVRLAVSTSSASGHGYDAEAAWASFDYVKGGATDSAAAATAMSTGLKTYDGRIGLDVGGAPLVHAVQRAEALGKATGVVTTMPFSHATPAGFVAHNTSRDNYAEIGREMVMQSDVDVIMGCGNPLYDSDGRAVADEDANFDYVGGLDVWQALAEGTAGLGTDADHNGALDDAWQLVETAADFRALGDGPAPKRVIGVARVDKTLQYGRSGDAGAPPFAVPLTGGVPTLPEMTRAALNVLDGDADGLFLMVEGGAVDSASHDSRTGRMIEEQLDFNAAVRAAVEWVERESNWDETLVIVTADHECGYLTRAVRGEGDVPWADELPEGAGAGAVPAVSWQCGWHTNSLVPLYARGAGADLFARYVVGQDPKRGAYVDNTAIGRLVADLWR